MKPQSETDGHADPSQPEKAAIRHPGALRGKIKLAPDFDEFPAEVLDAMETPLS